MTVTTGSPAKASFAQVDPALATREATPVKYWAAAGAFFFALGAYLMIGWVFSSDFAPTPSGPTPVPVWMKVSLVGVMIAGFVTAMVIYWLFLIRPWRREGHITFDGIFVLAFTCLWWQDPLINMVGPYFTYNSWVLNHGSWLGRVPGVIWPGAERFPEPILLNAFVAVYAYLSVVFVANWFMRRVKDRHPAMGKLGLILSCYAFLFVVDVALEMVMQRSGYWAYVATVKWLTIFPGTWWRFPLYEPLFWCFNWTAMASLRFFRDDRGRSVAERGIDRITGSPRKKTMLQFFAVFGMLNIFFLGLYTIPIQFFTLNADQPSRDLLKRSYFMNGVSCGGETTYACPGGGLPIPRRGSYHVGPQGELVPGELPLPKAVPFER